MNDMNFGFGPYTLLLLGLVRTMFREARERATTLAPDGVLLTLERRIAASGHVEFYGTSPTGQALSGELFEPTGDDPMADYPRMLPVIAGEPVVVMADDGHAIGFWLSDNAPALIARLRDESSLHGWESCGDTEPPPESPISGTAFRRDKAFRLVLDASVGDGHMAVLVQIDPLQMPQWVSRDG